MSGKTKEQLLKESSELQRQLVALKRVEVDWRRQTKQLNTLYQISLHIRKLKPEAELGQETIDLLEQRMGYEYGAILLIDQSSGKLVPYALSKQGRDAAFVEADKAYVASHGIALGTGITGWVAKAGQSVRSGDVRQDTRYHAMRDDIRSELCVPLCVGNQIIGVMNTETTSLKAYTKNDQRFMETVATQVALVIQNNRLYKQIQQRDKALQEAQEALVSIKTLRGFLTICSSCKKIRDEREHWIQVEEYLTKHTEVELTHGICPDCQKKLYPEFYQDY